MPTGVEKPAKSEMKPMNSAAEKTGPRASDCPIA